LRPGQQIRVLCSDRSIWTGRLAGVSGGQFVLDAGGTQRKVVRPEVLRVEVKSRVSSALTGLGIGAAAGVGFGYMAGSRGGLKSGEVGAAAGLGAGLFAAGGAGIGCLFPRWKTVYRADAAVPERAKSR
jgi:hypothetical protein